MTDKGWLMQELMVKRGSKVFSSPLENKTGEHPVQPVSAP